MTAEEIAKKLGITVKNVGIVHEKLSKLQNHEVPLKTNNFSFIKTLKERSSEKMTILKDHIEISESIEVAKGDLPCSYWQVLFFGRDFEPELTDSRYGFLLRAKPH